MRIVRNKSGQLSIFLGIGLLIIITLLAFIINVGLFVKAKINLQNATDAAAWSGAAVQARQLSNIAYLNWELRNNFKEWMFKYYVLGQISLKKTNADSIDINSPYFQEDDGKMSFRTNPVFKEGEEMYKTDFFDKFNIPSICLHYGGDGVHNMCELYGVPGLPRFPPVDIPAIGEAHEAFIDAISNAKSTDCAIRARLNSSIALTWAFGTKQDQIIEDTPEIVSHRAGAWPKAIELGMRIRNLEMIVNRPPVETPICKDSNGIPCTTINQLDSEYSELPMNERPIKAYMSAYRNLDDELRETFTLKELVPNPVNVSNDELGGFLIPQGAPTFATSKHYLDLLAYPINLATFFTTFITTKKGSEAAQGVTSDASCIGSKVALPVPAFLFGFVKNPEVVTYYAVKGEAKFVGLFFPFSNQDGITIKAYSASKPFGGRIGPMLFDIDDKKTVKPRNETTQSRSLPYISALDVNSLGVDFKPGFPLPLDNDFWVQSDSDPIGGVPDNSGKMKFGIPNLIYDYETSVDELDSHITSPDRVALQKIKQATSDIDSRQNIQETVGLYDKQQFKKFIDNLVDDNNLTPENIDRSIERVRRPTKYEALNYLIPTFQNDKADISSPSIITNMSEESDKVFYKLYAPLYGTETLYPEISLVTGIVSDIIEQSDTAIDTFVSALSKAAQNIVDTYSAQDTTGAKDAAKLLCHLESEDKNETESLCGKLNYFFRGQSVGVSNVLPLKDAMVEFFNQESSNNNSDYKDYFSGSYIQPTNQPKGVTLNSIELVKDIMTAYMPGIRQGADNDGQFIHPLTRENQGYFKRNYYSTKFVAIEKLINTTDRGQSYFHAGVYMERPTLGQTPSDVVEPPAQTNFLQTDDLQEFGTLYH